MKHQKTLLALALLASAVITGTAQASLIARGPDMVYDDINNITWAADANLAKSSGYDSDGLMIYQSAIIWASQLTLGGYTDWQLPGRYVSDLYGYNPSNSIIGDLFYNQLGAVSGTDIAITHSANYNLFKNVHNYAYWTGDVWSTMPSSGDTWYLGTNGGAHVNVIQQFQFYAWAVRPGDVAASSVPVPAAVWLFGSGLIGLVSFTRRKHKSANLITA